MGMLITGDEAAKEVKKLCSERAPEVEKIYPVFFKALDVVELSWLTRLLDIM